MKTKFYAYKIENKIGITTSWDECKDIVKGKKARYRSFKTKDLAQSWLDNNCSIVLEKGIYFDAGTGGDFGTEARVTNENKKSLIPNANSRGNLNLKGFSNNYGELKALNIALKLAISRSVKKIFGDSKLVIDYWSKGRISKTLPESTLELALETTKIRKQFENLGGKIEHISGDINPADLGYHK